MLSLDLFFINLMNQMQPFDSHICSPSLRWKLLAYISPNFIFLILKGEHTANGEDQHSTLTFLSSVNPSPSNQTYIVNDETFRSVCVNKANSASTMTLASLWEVQWWYWYQQICINVRWVTVGNLLSNKR